MRKLIIAAVLMSGIAAGVNAQTADPLTGRVGKLEKEMKAVQRKVFPGGVELAPEIGGTPEPAIAAGSAATTPMADLTARIDALEAQLRTLTGQVETDGNRIRKLEEAVKALQPAEPAPAGPAPTEANPAPAVGGGETTAAVATPAIVAKPAAPASKPAAKPDPGRKAAIEAVEIPVTGDAAEDAYTYGFRLWQAKLYPEAQVKLKEFVAKNPSHRRTSYAQNLLGRAYLDEGKPALASVAFYDNYQKFPRGERAAESLSWLGSALIRLKKPADACKVYKEFEDVYGTKATAEVNARVTKGKTDAKCTA